MVIAWSVESIYLLAQGHLLYISKYIYLRNKIDNSVYIHTYIHIYLHICMYVYVFFFGEKMWIIMSCLSVGEVRTVSRTQEALTKKQQKTVAIGNSFN